MNSGILWHFYPSMVCRVFPVYNKPSLSLCQLYAFACVVLVCLATLFQYRYRTRLVPRRHTVPASHHTTRPRQKTSITRGWRTFEDNVKIWKMFVRHGNDKSESSRCYNIPWQTHEDKTRPGFYDDSVHLPPPAQLTPLDLKQVTMCARGRPGGGWFNLQGNERFWGFVQV